MSVEIGSKKPLMWEVMDKASALSMPLQVALELTYRCNLRCAHCYIDLIDKEELSLIEWKDVLHQLKSAGTIYLLFTGGEVTIRDDFMDIMNYARAKGFFVGLLTNSTRITPTIARAIANLRPFALGTSLYGATAASHETVTQIHGSFNKTLEGVKLLSNAGLVPTVQVLTMKSNLSELPKIEELVKSLGARPKIGGGMAPTKSGSEVPFSYEPRMEELMTCGHAAETENVESSGPGVCKAGRSICSISPRGDVFPCIMFSLKLGNLRLSTFDSIWSLEPCAELQLLRSMKQSDLQACGACEVKAYCKRCTGSAYAESRSMNGASPSACRQARMRARLTDIQKTGQPSI